MTTFAETEHDFDLYREGICNEECVHQLLSKNRHHNLRYLSNANLPTIGKYPIRNTRILHYYDIGMTVRRNCSMIVKEFNCSKNMDNYLKLRRSVAIPPLFIS
jgi:hypothetical protein